VCTRPVVRRHGRPLLLSLATTAYALDERGVLGSSRFWVGTTPRTPRRLSRTGPVGGPIGTGHCYPTRQSSFGLPSKNVSIVESSSTKTGDENGDKCSSYRNLTSKHKERAQFPQHTPRWIHHRRRMSQHLLAFCKSRNDRVLPPTVVLSAMPVRRFGRRPTGEILSSPPAVKHTKMYVDQVAPLCSKISQIVRFDHPRQRNMAAIGRLSATI
jgi:hypothetical protein